MAITIQHGNIATALGLAAMSGQAERQRFVSQQDLQFLNSIQGAQSEADRNYAQQIQLALQDKQNTAENALKQQTLQNQTDAHAADQANQDRQYNLAVANSQALQANRAASQGVESQRVDQGTQRIAQGTERLGLETQHQQTRADAQDLRNTKFDLQQQAIEGLPDETRGIVQATGRLPYIPNNLGRDTDTAALETEYRRLQSAAQIAQKAQDSSSYNVDQKYIGTPRGTKSASVPGAAAGLEQQYQQAAQQLQAMQQRATQIDAALRQRTQGMVNGQQTANPSAAVLQYLRAVGGGNVAQQQAQQAPAGNMPVVTTHEQYMALPSGASYINGNTGVTAVKP